MMELANRQRVLSPADHHSRSGIFTRNAINSINALPNARKRPATSGITAMMVSLEDDQQRNELPRHRRICPVTI